MSKTRNLINTPTYQKPCSLIISYSLVVVNKYDSFQK